MAELTLGQQFIFAILAVFALLGLIWPWLSLTSLGKLEDIAYEIRLIREELEKRNK